MVTLSEATIKAQQALSEKFGIPTFNLTGGISTVPVTRTLSTINVGTGMFTGETTSSLNQKLGSLIANAKETTGGTIGNTFVPSLSKPSPKPTPNANTTNDDVPNERTSGTFGQTLSEGFSQAADFFKTNPIALIGIFALVGLMVIKK